VSKAAFILPLPPERAPSISYPDQCPRQLSYCPFYWKVTYNLLFAARSTFQLAAYD